MRYGAMRETRILVLWVGIAALSSGPAIAQFGDIDIDVEAVEVTQGVQTVDNTEILIDFRPTTVRVYARILSASLRVSNVQARLRVLDGPTELLNLLSDNGPITVPLFVDREQADHTLNFTFTPELQLLGSATQDLTFEVTLDPFNAIQETNESNNTIRVNHEFECRRGPRIVYLPINHQSAGLPDPQRIEPGVGDAMLWGIYPWPRGPASHHGRYQASGLGALIWDAALTDQDDTSDLLTELGRQRVGLSPAPDHLYGWVRDNPCPCNGSGWSPGNEAFGNTDPARHQRTFAHEVGHNLGFGHVNGLTNEVGWDPGNSLDLGPVKTDDLFDIMVPAQQTPDAWVDPARYRGIYEDQRWQCTAFPPLDMLEMFHIAVFNENGPWNLGPVLSLVSERTPIERVVTGSGEIRILREGTGQLLHAQLFEPDPDIGDDPNHVSLGGSVVTPYFADAGTIELRIDGQLEASVTRSQNAPTVTITSPGPGEILDHRTTIQWTMTDLDGDPLEAFVRYSPDGELRWVPLGPLTRSTRLNLASSRLPASSSGVIEVRVTDGFNTAVAQVGPLGLGPDRAPQVSLLSPRDGQFFSAQANILFQAQTDDPEDGSLDEEQVNWHSQRDGQFGQGHSFQLSQLSEGMHELELRAEDDGGNVVTRRATIHVGIPPGGFHPGESSGSSNPLGQMIVTGFNDATGEVSVDYSPSCSATNHAIHFGSLSQVDRYTFTGTACSLGNSGSASFVPTGSDLYFLIVGDNGSVEGSYGRDTLGNERPENLDGLCPFPQKLGGTCD